MKVYDFFYNIHENNEKNLKFCDEIIFYDHYNIGHVIELNFNREYVIIVLFESDFKHEDNFIKILDITYDKKLMIIDGAVENLEDQIGTQRFSILQLLCLENLYKEELARENNFINMRLGGEDKVNQDRVESFLEKVSSI